MKFDAADVVEQGFCTPTAEKHRKPSKSDEVFLRYKQKWTMQKLAIIIVISITIIVVTGCLLMFTGLKEHVNQIGHYVVQKSPFNACNACADIKVIGGAEYSKFEKWTDEKGCLRLTITCGLERGTEAIIQWYNEDKDMGVSFMDRVGQSNVVRSLECNAKGHYELYENSHRGEITKIDCVVVFSHEEL
ncbi:hypothetical protein GPALN_010729 [Globodera pallida]|nr:hypothetical protein GPALN_010729 [Globodera pallida]